MEIKINKIGIGYSKKKLIKQLEENNIPIEKGLGYIVYKDSIDGVEFEVAAFTKGEIIYQVTITGCLHEHELPEVLLLGYSFSESEDRYIFLSGDLNGEYAINEENKNRNFYLRYSFNKAEVKHNNKSIYFCFMFFCILISALFYLVSLVENNFNALNLIYFVAGGSVFGLIMCVIYYYSSLDRAKDKYLKLKENVDEGYSYKVKCLTSYGNSSLNLKLNPMYLYLYDDHLVINLLFKNKELYFDYKYEDIKEIDYHSSFKLIVDDKEFVFFVDNRKHKDELVEKLKSLSLI